MQAKIKLNPVEHLAVLFLTKRLITGKSKPQFKGYSFSLPEATKLTLLIVERTITKEGVKSPYSGALLAAVKYLLKTTF